ncbi:MAG: hypothetical protein ACE37H_10715 [Phycisphaeraceae bacterium]
MISIESIEPFTQFGVAGLMGALWLWERVYSRKREQQLTQAHEHLAAQQTELHELIRLVQRNTAAIERFDKTQSRIADLLERMDANRRVA